MQLLMPLKDQIQCTCLLGVVRRIRNLPLDLACHQSVSRYKPCTNPADFLVLRPDMKRNRTTRPVISQIASEWPAVSDSRDRLALHPDTRVWENKFTPTHRRLNTGI